MELQRFLGCVNFYHRFLPKLATTLAPLHGLTSSAKTQKSPLIWTPELRQCYMKTRECLTSVVRLVHPDLDPFVRLGLTTDALDVAIGEVLSQNDNEPLGFFSKKWPRQNTVRLIESN